jgi:hypothetical protein
VDASLPTFLVVGAMKGGTTSLWQYLREHPDVYLPEEKEPDFFVEEKNWSRGIDWYRQLFARADAPVRGEASTNYAKHPMFAGVPARIASVVPDIRIVYVVRDPMKRIVSHYRHALRAGWERRPFEQALLADGQYVAISSYGMQLRQYFEHFARERVLVITTEDLRQHRESTVGKVLAFLGVDPAIPHTALASEHHAAPQRPVRRRPATIADRIPGRRVMSRAIPRPLRTAYARATHLDHPSRMRLSDATRARVMDRLGAEAADLHGLTGVTIDQWELGR